MLGLVCAVEVQIALNDATESGIRDALGNVSDIRTRGRLELLRKNHAKP